MSSNWKAISTMPTFITTTSNTLLVLLIFYSLLSCTHSQIDRIRLCVPDSVYEHCLRMSDNVPGTFTCIKARDKFECIRLIEKDEADIANLDAEDLYLAGRLHGLEPFVVEEYNGNIYRYKSGVLVPRNSEISSLADLKGKRTCLAGFGQNAGWNIQMGILLATETLTPDCRSELFSVENFLGPSCAPGKWSEDLVVDDELKKRHPKLCSLCKDPSTCTSSDPYAEPQGAIKCLTEGQAQVAYTTIEAAEQYFRNRPEERDLYQFLCLDGSRMPITRRACDWARRPTNTFVIKRGRARQKDIYLRYLQQIFFRFSQLRPSWFTQSFVSSENVTQLVSVPFNMQQWDKYLGNYIPSIEKPLPGCERKNVTICVTSSMELDKCSELQKTAYARRIRPQIRCFQTDSRSACIEAVNNRKADIVSLDADEFYHAGRHESILPIAVEKRENPDYAVAVVQTQSDILSLAQLRGHRSCHTAFGDKSGWLVPVSTLLRDGILNSMNCNRAQEMALFFAGSCAPGAADARINSNGTGVENLCAQCVGNDRNEHVCEKSTAERYSGEEGAFRCLVEGRGDVAFLTHFTPLQFTDGNSSEPWAKSAKSLDYRLLCRESGKENSEFTGNGNDNSNIHNNRRLGNLGEYKHCNLAALPGHVVVTSASTPYENRFEAVQVVTKLSEMFGKKYANSFNLFGKFKNQSNLLFGDGTSHISAVPSGVSSVENVLDRQFLQILEDNDPDVCLNHAASYQSLTTSKLTFILSTILTSLLFSYSSSSSS